MTDVERELRQSYASGAADWAAGPARVYERLARALVDLRAVELEGRCVLDLGAGTGVASTALARAGARVIAVDVAAPMLRHDARKRPPAACADAARLPFASDAFDAAFAACVFNHVPDLEDALRETARVVGPDGAVVASAFPIAAHPVKEAVDEVLARNGYVPPAWYVTFKDERERRTGDPIHFRDSARAAGFAGVDVRAVDVDLGDLDASALAAYRLGMAHVRPFVVAMDQSERIEFEQEATAAAAAFVAVSMTILVLVARVPAHLQG